MKPPKELWVVYRDWTPENPSQFLRTFKRKAEAIQVRNASEGVTLLRYVLASEPKEGGE